MSVLIEQLNKLLKLPDTFKPSKKHTDVVMDFFKQLNNIFDFDIPVPSCQMNFQYEAIELIWGCPGISYVHFVILIDGSFHYKYNYASEVCKATNCTLNNFPSALKKRMEIWDVPF